MAGITAADVAKLRKVTLAGMMDCKKALEEANGDFDKAIEIIRKKGQAVANKRADREASEGVVLAKVRADGKLGKFFRENTLLNQDFVKDNKQTIGQYLKSVDKELSVTGFRRFTLNL